MKKRVHNAFVSRDSEQLEVNTSLIQNQYEILDFHIQPQDISQQPTTTAPMCRGASFDCGHILADCNYFDSDFTCPATLYSVLEGPCIDCTLSTQGCFGSAFSCGHIVPSCVCYEPPLTCGDIFFMECEWPCQPCSHKKRVAKRPPLQPRLIASRGSDTKSLLTSSKSFRSINTKTSSTSLKSLISINTKTSSISSKNVRSINKLRGKAADIHRKMKRCLRTLKKSVLFGLKQQRSI